MKAKIQSLFLAALILLVLMITITAAYFSLFFLPGYASNIFGSPSQGLEQSQTILLSAKLYFARDQLLVPVSNDQIQEVFIVNSGETGTEIAISLEDRGFIHQKESFIDYLVYKGIDRVLQSGVYLISRDMNPKRIADSLIDQSPEDVAFSFPAGWRVEEIAALLPSSGTSISLEDFLAYIKNPSENTIEGIVTNPESFEGLLFPGEYQVLRSISVEDFTKMLTASFYNQLTPEYKKRVKSKNLSLYDAVILASIVEKETVLPEEAPQIAGVFINRLENGMPLQSDPTAQYAIGYDEESDSWWKNPLSAEDLKIESPYNTYINLGLPPTPICNPGLNSLMAVAYAEKNDFFYFRSACDGSGRHVFSRTYAEHLAAACH